jgi:deazaflavin-dependent oxidoreductase (nitroreductase family)
MIGMNAVARMGFRIANPVVRALLSSPAGRSLSGALLVLSYRGRRSGRVHSLPLQYARHGDCILVMAGTASRKAWWRNFREPMPVTVTLAGTTTPHVAHVLTGRARDEALAVYSARFPRMNTREDVEFVELVAAPPDEPRDAGEARTG